MAITLDGTNGVTASSPATIKASAYLDAAGGNTATINGKLPIALADVPAPTTAQVGTATAGLAAGAVGSYAFLAYQTANTVITAGSTFAGSSMFYAAGLSFPAYAINTSAYGVAPSGTWRAMGTSATTNTGGNFPTTIFLRIS